MLDSEELRYLEQMKADILRESAQSTQILLENIVMKQLALLADGQQTILQILAPKRETQKNWLRI